MHLSSLQVHGEAYGLCLEVCRFCANLEKTYKYSLGEQLRNTAFRLIVEIDAAHIAESRRLLSEAQLCIRMLVDLNAMSHKRFLSFVEMTDKVSRQLMAWERSKSTVTSAGVPMQ